MVYIPRKSYPLAWTRPQIMKDLIEGGMDQAMASNIADTLQKINHKQAVDERLNYRAIEGIQSGKPYATIVVAASNSTAPGASEADYVCSGTDDQDTINLALAAADDRGHVLLLEGIYNLSGSIIPPSGGNQWISGQGYGTHIRYTGSGYAIDPVSGAHSIRISDMRLEAATNRTGNGLSVTESDSWVWNCHIEDFDVGIGVGGTGVQGIHIIDNNIYNCEYGIAISGLNWGLIARNFIYSDVCIQSNASWSQIINNTIRGAANNNIPININGGTHSRYCDNVIVGGYRGIFGQLMGACYHMICDNKIRDCQSEGIYIFDSDDIMIHNNSVIAVGIESDNVNSAILVSSCDRCSVQGNMVRYGTSNRHRYGIHVNGGNDNFVTNNDLKNSGVTGSLNDTGTGTITAAGNRL